MPANETNLHGEEPADEGQYTDLRREAEHQLAQRADRLEPLTPAEVQQLMHELEVHQIELQMQNEALRQAQTALETTRDRFIDLYDLAPVGYLTLDAQGIILEANLTAGVKLGVEREQLIRQNFGRFVARDEQNVYYLHRKRLFDTETAQVFELRLKRKGKVDFYARLEAIYMAGKNGVAPTCRVVVSDITALKQAEAEVLRYQHHLEELRAARTAELTEANQQLSLEILERQRAEARLEENTVRLELLNQELRDFAWVASHDLQEPLRKMRAFSEVLLKEASPRLSPDEQDHLGRIHNAAVRLQTMIESLLAYTRITTDTWSPVEVDLNQVVAEVLDDLQFLKEENQGQVEVSDLPIVDGDPVQMRQLFQNLVANALKFHRPQIPPVVRIEAEILRDKLQISVRDNGIGFDEARLNQLFQPFRRLVSHSQFQGSGIGLAICRKIVNRHWGSITARSIPGQGSTFIVTLPLKQMAARA